MRADPKPQQTAFAPTARLAIAKPVSGPIRQLPIHGVAHVSGARELGVGFADSLHHPVQHSNQGYLPLVLLHLVTPVRHHRHKIATLPIQSAMLRGATEHAAMDDETRFSDRNRRIYPFFGASRSAALVLLTKPTADVVEREIHELSDLLVAECRLRPCVRHLHACCQQRADERSPQKRRPSRRASIVPPQAPLNTWPRSAIPRPEIA